MSKIALAANKFYTSFRFSTCRNNINTRVRVLEAKDYLRKTGERETKAGGKAVLYEATAKAHFALSVSSICIDDLINELDENTTLAIVNLIISR